MFNRSFKQTKLWCNLRNIKNTFVNKLNYFKAKRMPEKKYEDYICKKYAFMMDRFDFSKGKRMDFENPLTFTQKQQWLALYDQNPKKVEFTDKYLVRKYIKETIGDKYLVPLINIKGIECFDKVEQIDFNFLPNQFVIKCTHGSHMNIIVKDKSSLSNKQIKSMKKQLKKWQKTDYSFSACLELQYHYIKPRFIIEEYIAINDDLPDYKFFCFNGRPCFMWVDQARFFGHRRTVYDLKFKKAPFTFDLLEDVEGIEKPKCFEEMVLFSEKLSKDFSFVRVDFYEHNEQLFFSELTFSSHAGLMAPKPIEYDSKLGDLISIDKNIRDKDYRFRKK